jgi:hypothetical protein
MEKDFHMTISQMLVAMKREMPLPRPYFFSRSLIKCYKDAEKE